MTDEERFGPYEVNWRNLYAILAVLIVGMLLVGVFVLLTGAPSDPRTVVTRAEAEGREAAKLWSTLLGPDYVGVSCVTLGPPHDMVSCKLKRTNDTAPIFLNCYVETRQCEPVLPEKEPP